MYEIAAEADRADIIRRLFELGADTNVYVAAAQDARHTRTRSRWR